MFSYEVRTRNSKTLVAALRCEPCSAAVLPFCSEAEGDYTAAAVTGRWLRLCPGDEETPGPEGESLMPWQPWEIRFTREQVEWLLPHLEEMRRGQYPSEGQDTGYYDVPIKHHPSGHAPFETPCMIAAELDMRIERCGSDGILLRWHYCEGKSLDEISKGAHRSRDDIERRIARVMAYICGRHARRKTYEYFVTHHKTPPRVPEGGELLSVVK